jgi:CRISPR-associated exonuclease Cas4
MEPQAPLMISAIEHYVYCPRQCALIHVDGVWHENAHTTRGTYGHRRVDSGVSRDERGRKVLRSIPLWSEEHDLTGRADAVEVYDDGTIVPIEYKMGTRHGRAADLQLCAQALCLEEMTRRTVSCGFVWYSGPRRRMRVELDQQLRRETLGVIAAIRETVRTGVLPVAVDDARCAQCQLRDHCLPELASEHGPRRTEDYLRKEVLACES